MNVADERFVAQVRSGTLSSASFHHRDHLRLAFLLIAEYGISTAADTVYDTIEDFAATRGQGAKFHATMTAIWPRLIASHMLADDKDFEVFIVREGSLLNKELPLRFYSSERLMSTPARKRYIEPDRTDLPRIPAWCLRNQG